MLALRRFPTSFPVIAFVLMALPSPALAQMFAGFDQFCQVPVVVVPNPQGASAARDQLGNPVIFVDPGVMANWTMSRKFVLAHECGHHVRGHTLPEGMWFRNMQAWATRQQELEADCWAAKQLAATQDTRELERMITQFAGQGPMPQGPYPSGTERAQMVARCASIGTDLVNAGGSSSEARGDSRTCSDDWLKCRAAARESISACRSSCENGDNECRSSCESDRKASYAECDDIKHACRESWSPPENRGYAQPTATPSPATTCTTPFGVCMMMAQGIVGAPCYCVTPVGPVSGVAR